MKTFSVFIIRIFILTSITATCLYPFQCLAQQKPFTYYGFPGPYQTFIQDNNNTNLFHQYISSFKKHYKKDTCSLYVALLNEYTCMELDSVFWKYVFIIPGFNIFPAFRLDCVDGYVVGLFYAYHSRMVDLCNLDVISYSRDGQIRSRTVFPIYHTGYYNTQDSCIVAFQSLGGVLHIDNGIITYNYGSCRCCTPEILKNELYADDPKAVKREEYQYVYRIEDNACLTQMTTQSSEQFDLK